MADLNQLKQKYAPVIDTIQSFSAEGASVGNVSLDGEQLLLQASVPSPVVANRVWDSIKQVDATYSDLHHEITTTGTTQSYTIQSGDSLSKIAQHQYGNANLWSKIYEANKDTIKNPDLIHPGQQLIIPD